MLHSSGLSIFVGDFGQEFSCWRLGVIGRNQPRYARTTGWTSYFHRFCMPWFCALRSAVRIISFCFFFDLSDFYVRPAETLKISNVIRISGCLPVWIPPRTWASVTYRRTCAVASQRSTATSWWTWRSFARWPSRISMLHGSVCGAMTKRRCRWLVMPRNCTCSWRISREPAWWMAQITSHIIGTVTWLNFSIPVREVCAEFEAFFLSSVAACVHLLRLCGTRQRIQWGIYVDRCLRYKPLNFFVSFWLSWESSLKTCRILR